MFKKYYGFDVNDWDIGVVQRGIGKYGIYRGYETEIDKHPALTKVYYYVPVGITVVEDTDSTFCVNYDSVSEIDRAKLEVIRSRFITEMGTKYVSELRFYESVGEAEPGDTRHESVRCNCDTSSDEEKESESEAEASVNRLLAVIDSKDTLSDEDEARVE